MQMPHLSERMLRRSSYGSTGWRTTVALALVMASAAWALELSAAPTPPDAAAAPEASAPKDRKGAVYDPAPPSSIDSNAAEAGGEAGEWYGWQVLVVDVAAIAAGLAVAEVAEFSPGTRPSTIGLVGGVWYGIGGVGAPTVHWAHHQTGLGLASLGFRTLAPPFVGSLGALGHCVGSEFDDGCASDGFAGGTFVGLAGAAIIDAALLANEQPRSKPAHQESWYGWQTLMLDGATVVGGIVLATSLRDKEGRPPHPSIAIWTPSYVVGLFSGPIVHFAHGNVGKGFGSLGLRGLAGPMGVLPGLMGYCAATGGHDGCARAGALWGLTGGLAVVSAIDAFALAYEPVESDTSSTPPPSVMVGPGSIAVAGYW
jgi:hypothetical protein